MCHASHVVDCACTHAPCLPSAAKQNETKQDKPLAHGRAALAHAIHTRVRPGVPPGAERSTLGKLVGPLGPVALRGVLEPVVTSVVILRDKVEQDRFVVR